MKLPRRKFLHLAAGAAALYILSLSNAWCQTARTIKIVVPFPPGGTTDILARLLAEQVSRAQGPTMVVENRPGAGTVIATEAVSRAAPDGNTVLMVANSFVINPNLKKLSYDPLTSFAPICLLTRAPNTFVVSNSSPYRTLADLLNAARAKPGELTLASVGPATTQHIAIEVLKRMANVNMTYVPFSGDAPAANALLGEHVTAAVITYPSVAEQLKSGKLRALATASQARVELLPDVPTVAESGYQNYQADTWYGAVAPVKTPQESVSHLAGWFSSALQAPAVRPKLVAQGLFPVGTCGSDFAAHLRKQFEEYGRAIREANIKAE
jgi:tripartite-type tricarboxylate transporter receptor subunit TctC